MSMTTIDETALNAFVMRAVDHLGAGYLGVMVSLGSRLGLYQALAEAGPLTSQQLAERTDCAERYVRDWASSQAAAGYVEYDPEAETFALTPEQALVLAAEDSPVYLPPAWNTPAAMWSDEAKALHAFRTGEGIAWGDHDPRLAHGTAAFYRNGYRASLVSQWLPALDGVVSALERGIAVADVGVGHGHTAVLIAEAFPNSRVYGFDTHAASISESRRNARAAGVDDRTVFEQVSAKEYDALGFGLICFFDALHDMGDPVGVLRHAAEALTADGTLLLVEPNAADRLEDNFTVVGQTFFAASSMICTAHAIADGGELVLGAQAGPARLREVLGDAGFSRVRIVAETPFNLIIEAKR
ncbi:SAM-dependent methyltransferase [Microbacterium terrae]|uniref:Trans-aconitate 2-methyltransferase n=1 Tax=Microbacterium terrae TaxID=69369 RepID=A0A0M2H3B2_9MICO|nr:methyltransferase domain-containing protein [Microbacterium terrae]KJL38793.1 Trans-aconitate 2-methyltransferase [Microbacterium terrae]MBP1076212.1 SAM-dependent methyltransferase [Microbacterium terrae]GLJ97033.1 SAM-dependent methyltransferase [Microbacterium terrae]